MRATVFGLDLSADQPLSFLERARARATGRPMEVSLDCGAAPRWPEEAELISDQRLPGGEINFRIEKHSPAGYRIWGPAYGSSVLAADGRRLWGARGEVSTVAWQRLLIAQALPFAAVLQGLEVLHASAVVSKGGAIAFAGPSGSGKTSIALELSRHGMPLLADDVIALEACPELLVHPGAPVAGVDRDEVRRLDEERVRRGEALAADARETVERVELGAEPVPLRAVFLLERAPDGPAEPRFEPAGEATALLACTFNLVLRDPARLARLLDVCARAAEQRVERVVFGPGVSASQLSAAVVGRIGSAQ